MLGLKPQITPQFVPTSVTGWIQIAEITTLKSREAWGPLPRFSGVPLPCGSSLPCQAPIWPPTACPPPSNPHWASLGKHNLGYKYKGICVSCEDWQGLSLL